MALLPILASDISLMFCDLWWCFLVKYLNIPGRGPPYWFRDVMDVRPCLYLVLNSYPALGG